MRRGVRGRARTEGTAHVNERWQGGGGRRDGPAWRVSGTQRTGARSAPETNKQERVGLGVQVYDTIAATINLTDQLDRALFSGGSVTDDFDTGRRSARLWRNDAGNGGYHPRVTYWPLGDTLKVEFSVCKMAETLDVDDAARDLAFDRVSAIMRHEFGVVTDVQDWACQRIDYTYTFDTAPHDAEAYLQVFDELRLAGARRHSFKGEGVVFKAGNRWTKFYQKDAMRLRFEVSNYRQAVDYMANKWFDCPRTVREMAQPGRALYVLAEQWHRLGLDVDRYSHVVSRDQALRDAFGQSVASAHYVLHLHREYGRRDALDLGLVSGSTFGVWTARLRDSGFLAVSDDENVSQSLPSLKLPADVLRRLLENLGDDWRDNKDDAEKKWGKICRSLGLAQRRPNPVLLGMYDDLV